MGKHFSTVSMIWWFVSVGGHLRNSGFTCTGFHFWRICLRFPLFVYDHNGEQIRISGFSFFAFEQGRGGEKERQAEQRSNEMEEKT